MKVHELMQILQEYDPEDEITVSPEGQVLPVTEVNDNSWNHNVTIGGD
jgi:hypothetical protein